MRNSLTGRIILLSIFWIILALLATAFLLGRLYRQLTDPRFLTLNSGWYWEVLYAGEPLEKSPSLGHRKHVHNSAFPVART